uniref:progestin and adipoQ receptor family member 4 isoform X2 n=1 Tax=Myxine glutinosa TaxID=7769 RepID=UPI00358F1434
MSSKLLQHSSAPGHLQFNPFVLTGYRSPASVITCVRSLLYVHNETGNIYSHAIAFFLFLVILPSSLPWGSLPGLSANHLVACLAPPLTSVIYHLFMAHKGGQSVYSWLLALDLCGISAITTFGALPIILYSFRCHSWLQLSMSTVHMVLSLATLPRALLAPTSYSRMGSFAGQGFLRAVCYAWRMADDHPHDSALSHYLWMELMSVVGGLLNVLRLPERFSPGTFDFWFNSHQLMHLLVVCAILNLHWGVVLDLHWEVETPCPS